MVTIKKNLFKENTYSCLLAVDYKVHRKGLEYFVLTHTIRHHDFSTMNNLGAKHIQLLINKVMLFQRALDRSPTY